MGVPRDFRMFPECSGGFQAVSGALGIRRFQSVPGYQRVSERSRRFKGYRSTLFQKQSRAAAAVPKAMVFQERSREIHVVSGAFQSIPKTSKHLKP